MSAPGRLKCWSSADSPRRGLASRRGSELGEGDAQQEDTSRKRSQSFIAGPSRSTFGGTIQPDQCISREATTHGARAPASATTSTCGPRWAIVAALAARVTVGRPSRYPAAAPHPSGSSMRTEHEHASSCTRDESWRSRPSSGRPWARSAAGRRPGPRSVGCSTSRRPASAITSSTAATACSSSTSTTGTGSSSGSRPPGSTSTGKPLNVKGICASAATRRIYISTTKTLTCLDLVTEKVLWERAYPGRLRPDGDLARRQGDLPPVVREATTGTSSTP